MKNPLIAKARLYTFTILLIVSMLSQSAFIMPVRENHKKVVSTAPIFGDVPESHWAFQHIQGLYNAGITGGCNANPLLYCPENPVTRAQMAVFILRGMHGSAYTPTNSTGTVFADVPLGVFADAWIEQFSFEGITAGCTGDSYCPDANVTRAQMAVFLLRGKYGNSYAPPAASGTVFTDVPLGSFADAWIEQLATEGITGGCGNNQFCPDAFVTRAQMAVFLVRTFNLSLETLAPIIPETTKVIPSTTSQYLSSVSGDGTVYTFSQMTQELSELAPGQIMVSDGGPAAPQGYLKKVVSISESGGQVIVQTEPVGIEEAIQQGEVSVSQALTPNAKQAVFAKGVEPVDVPAAAGGFSLQLNNVVLYDADGNENTTGDQINANGLVSLAPIFNFKLKVENYQLKEFYYSMTTNQTSQLRIASKVFVTVRAEKILATYPMGPLFLTIGPVPVTVYPVLTLVAGVDGSISANVSTGITQKLVQTSGLKYENNSWSPIRQFSSQFNFDQFTFNQPDGFDIKGYIGVKLKILLYDSVGPDISLKAYLKLEVKPLETPWWKLYGGVEVSAGISIGIFSHVIAGFNAVVIDYRVLIAQPGGCAPGQTIYDPANDTSAAHIDITKVNTMLNGETLQAVFSIRDVPPRLTFNRLNIPLSYVEYEWGVWVDVDNNPETGLKSKGGGGWGSFQGVDYLLWAMHYITTPNSPISQPISNVVNVGVWKVVSPNSWQRYDAASLIAAPISDTITMVGKIPGITSSSRLVFDTYDYDPEGDGLTDLTSCSLMASYKYPLLFKAYMNEESIITLQELDQVPGQ
jgi:hypothetical protein